MGRGNYFYQQIDVAEYYVNKNIKIKQKFQTYFDEKMLFIFSVGLGKTEKLRFLKRPVQLRL